MTTDTEATIELEDFHIPLDKIVWTPPGVKPWSDSSAVKSNWLPNPFLIALDQHVGYRLDALCERYGMSHSECIEKLLSDADDDPGNSDATEISRG